MKIYAQNHTDVQRRHKECRCNQLYSAMTKTCVAAAKFVTNMIKMSKSIQSYNICTHKVSQNVAVKSDFFNSNSGA